MKKNVAVSGLSFHAIDFLDGSNITTGSITGLVLKNGVISSISSPPTHIVSGIWNFGLTASETNADIFGVTFYHTNILPIHFNFITETKLVSELNDISSANVRVQVDAGLSGIGATSGRMSNLDNLNQDISGLPNRTDIFLSNIHGSGQWDDLGINQRLSDVHGSGLWETSILTFSGIAQEVDAVLSSNHGSGIWDVSGVPFTVNDRLSLVHGSGSWQVFTPNEVAQEVDTVLTETHGSGSWISADVSIASSGIAVIVNDLLVQEHGDGFWNASGAWNFDDRRLTNVDNIAALIDDLSNVHGSGSWKTSTFGITASGIAEEVNSVLTLDHGSGLWNASGTWNFTDRRLTDAFDLAQDIDDILAAQHGSGLWTTNIPGTNLVTVIAKDQNGNTIGGARAEVRPEGAPQIIGLGLTHMVEGTAIFNLDDGDYDFYLFKTDDTVWDNPFNFTISADTTVELSGVKFSVPVQGDFNTVRIYALVRDIGGDPIEGVELLVSPSGVPQEYGQQLLSQLTKTALSDVNGLVYLDVGSGMPIKIDIPKVGLNDKYILTPNSGLFNVITD